MPQIDIHILKTLISAQGTFVSGNALAGSMGITRVGIWARLEKLRDAGFGIEAVRHRGYRLTQEPCQLHDRLLQAHLQLDGTTTEVLYHASIDSTNSEAERQLANGRPAPFVIAAGEQTRGRGRLGRTWHSPDEGNLYLSFAFRPERPHARMQTITLWLGLEVCRHLNEQWNLPVRIKWPNDLLLGGRKIAGMLTEARIDADRTRDLIFGLGLNINGKPQGWPPEIAAVATSLAQHHPANQLPANRIGASLIKVCTEAYATYLATEDTSALLADWDRYDALQGQTVKAMWRNEPLEGVAKGIDASGALRIRTEQGRVVTVNSGEISLGTRPV